MDGAPVNATATKSPAPWAELSLRPGSLLQRLPVFPRVARIHDLSNCSEKQEVQHLTSPGKKMRPPYECDFEADNKFGTVLRAEALSQSMISKHLI